MTTERKTSLPILQVGDREETGVGGYFVANYPPFEQWRREEKHLAADRLSRAPAAGTPLGIYVHVPFCRKRCDFCYYKVYTDKDSREVRRYLDAVLTEAARLAEQPFVRGRRPLFVYFGGGTPSYLSAEQLTYLFEGLQHALPWDGAEEVTFECEPGTLQEKKLATLRALGVTRLSIGVENFDPEILEHNNRAHRAKEIDQAYGWARAQGFPQINLDMIAGMVGETDANWQDCIAKLRALAPDSVTIYQMEVPANTTLSRRMQARGEQVAPVADWQTKRRWMDEMFRGLEADGYTVCSAYTAVKDPAVRFLYRDGLWHGSDMLGIGVSSFSYLDGVHAQNESQFEAYVEAVEGGGIPCYRAMATSADDRLIREFVLQLKLGRVSAAAFRARFGVDIRERFAEPLRQQAKAGLLRIEGDAIVLSRDGLLQADRLLHSFFA
jgi:oxygen-independent coproporphyrinogen-3 oxidase